MMGWRVGDYRVARVARGRKEEEGKGWVFIGRYFGSKSCDRVERYW